MDRANYLSGDDARRASLALQIERRANSVIYTPEEQDPILEQERRHA